MSRDSSGGMIETLERRQLASVSAISIYPIPKIIHETAASLFTADLGSTNGFPFFPPGAIEPAISTSRIADPFLLHATINWGDGKPSQGTLVANEFGGYDIDGTHLYKRAGHYHILVTIYSSPTGTGPQPLFVDLYQPIQDIALVSPAPKLASALSHKVSPAPSKR